MNPSPQVNRDGAKSAGVIVTVRVGDVKDSARAAPSPKTSTTTIAAGRPPRNTPQRRLAAFTEPPEPPLPPLMPRVFPVMPRVFFIPFYC